MPHKPLKEERTESSSSTAVPKLRFQKLVEAIKGNPMKETESNWKILHSLFLNSVVWRKERFLEVCTTLFKPRLSLPHPVPKITYAWSSQRGMCSGCYLLIWLLNRNAKTCDTAAFNKSFATGWNVVIEWCNCPPCPEHNGLILSSLIHQYPFVTDKRLRASSRESLCCDNFHSLQLSSSVLQKRNKSQG